VFYTTGALNPLSPFGKCSHLEHRQILARSFATSTAIYADYAIASDSITQLLRQEPFDIVAIEQLHNDFLVIQELMPLLREGILRLGEPVRFCRVHHREALAVSKKVAKQLLTTILDDAVLTFEAAKGGFGFLGVESSALDSPAYFLLAPDSPRSQAVARAFLGASEAATRVAPDQGNSRVSP
jgi:hypothetical protein